jgi:hypothetical protein
MSETDLYNIYNMISNMYIRLQETNDLEERVGERPIIVNSVSSSSNREIRRRGQEYNNVMQIIRNNNTSINDILNNIFGGDRLLQTLITTVNEYNDTEEDDDDWLEEKVIVSLSESEFERFKEFTYTDELLQNKLGGTKGVCLVCLEDYKLNDTLIELNCGDYYHKDCIKMWLLKNSVNCPNCNIDQRQ